MVEETAKIREIEKADIDNTSTHMNNQKSKRRRVSAKTEEKNLGLTTVDIDRRSATTSALEHTAASAAFLLVLYISLLFSTYILALCDMQAMKYLYESTLEYP